jgi:hypothetical protein
VAHKGGTELVPAPAAALKASGLLQVATPERAAELIDEYAAATGIERYYTWTIPPGVPVRRMDEHLELFATHVMPRFRWRAPAARCRSPTGTCAWFDERVAGCRTRRLRLAGLLRHDRFVDVVAGEIVLGRSMLMRHEERRGLRPAELAAEAAARSWWSRLGRFRVGAAHHEPSHRSGRHRK